MEMLFWFTVFCVVVFSALSIFKKVIKVLLKYVTTKELFKCDHCNHSVTFVFGIRRTHDGLKIPDDMPVATCSNCGEMYVDADEVEEFNNSI